MAEAFLCGAVAHDLGEVISHSGTRVVIKCSSSANLSIRTELTHLQLEYKHVITLA
jgi:hypothetical protein